MVYSEIKNWTVYVSIQPPQSTLDAFTAETTDKKMSKGLKPLFRYELDDNRRIVKLIFCDGTVGVFPTDECRELMAQFDKCMQSGKTGVPPNDSSLDVGLNQSVI
jgi:hypothetical protein